MFSILTLIAELLRRIKMFWISIMIPTHLWTFSKSKFNLKSDRVNLVAPSAWFTLCPGDTLQTGTGKVDPARKFKCATAARVPDKLVALVFVCANQNWRSFEVTKLPLCSSERICLRKSKLEELWSHKVAPVQFRTYLSTQIKTGGALKSQSCSCAVQNVTYLYLYLCNPMS